MPRTVSVISNSYVTLPKFLLTLAYKNMYMYNQRILSSPKQGIYYMRNSHIITHFFRCNKLSSHIV